MQSEECFLSINTNYKKFVRLLCRNLINENQKNYTMKKSLIFGSLLALSSNLVSQALPLLWGGTSNNQYANAYRVGNIGVGISNNITRPITLPFCKLEVFTNDGSGLGITETGSNPASLILRNTGANDSPDYAWFINTLSNGHFTIQDESKNIPSIFIHKNTGNIAVGGSTSPNAMLHIGDGAASLHTAPSTKGILIKFASGQTDRALMEFHDPSGQNRLAIQSLYYGSYLLSLDAKPLFLQTVGGNVSVGTDTPLPSSNAKLLINVDPSQVNAFDVINSATQASSFRVKTSGTVYAREIFVLAPSTPIPDYVFATDYKLPNLKDVELYYKANKHLPEIPSEKEIKDKGINVGEMNILLLKKVEELTIYVVELKKEVEAFKKADK